MPTKTISIADDAYARLAAHKQDRESFTDVIRRLTGRQDLMRHAGVLEADAADLLRSASTDVRGHLDRERDLDDKRDA